MVRVTPFTVSVIEKAHAVLHKSDGEARSLTAELSRFQSVWRRRLR